MKRTLMVFSAIVSFAGPAAMPYAAAAESMAALQDREGRGGRDRSEARSEHRENRNSGGDSDSGRSQPSPPSPPPSPPSPPSTGGGRDRGGDQDRGDRGSSWVGETARIVTGESNGGQDRGRDRGGDRDGGRGRDGDNDRGRGDRDGGWTRDNDRDRGGDRNGGRGRDRDNDRDRGGRDGGWNRDNDRNGGWDRNRNRDRQRSEWRQRFNSDSWRRDWDRGRRSDWWRHDHRFRGWSGVRFGFYFAPGYGYYNVPRSYYGQRWYPGQYLPSVFWRYRLDDWRTFGLGYPPAGTRWVYVDNAIYLIDEYDGYIIDVVRDAWRW